MIKIGVYLCASVAKKLIVAGLSGNAKTKSTNPYCKTEFTNPNAFNFLSLSV